MYKKNRVLKERNLSGTSPKQQKKKKKKNNWHSAANGLGVSCHTTAKVRSSGTKKKNWTGFGEGGKKKLPRGKDGKRGQGRPRTA